MILLLRVPRPSVPGKKIAHRARMPGTTACGTEAALVQFGRDLPQGGSPSCDLPDHGQDIGRMSLSLQSVATGAQQGRLTRVRGPAGPCPPQGLPAPPGGSQGFAGAF